MCPDPAPGAGPAGRGAPCGRPAWRCRPGLAALLAGALLTGTAACGVRLETPEPTPPVADRTEEARQQAAVAAATLAATAAQVAEESAAEPDLAAALEQTAAAARDQGRALGGVWQAWPEGAPEGVATTPPATAAPPSPTAEDVLELLTGGAADARAAALTAPDGELAAVLASVAIGQDDDAAALAAALGAEHPPAPGTALSPAALLARGADGPTLLVLDQARYALETVAAQATGGQRSRAVARVAELRLLIDAAVAAGAPDRRLAAYELPEAGGLDEMQAVAVGAEQQLLRHWLFSLTLVAPEEREALVGAAEQAAEGVRAWGGEIPPLPGLEG